MMNISSLIFTYPKLLRRQSTGISKDGVDQRSGQVVLVTCSGWGLICEKKGNLTALVAM